MRSQCVVQLWLFAALLIWLVAVPVAQAFYNPSQGRWLNRDSIEERGGPNINAFGNGDTVSMVDALGQTVWSADVLHFYNASNEETEFRMGLTRRSELGPYYSKVDCAADCIKVTNYRWTTIFAVYVAGSQAGAQVFPNSVYNYSTFQGHEDTHIGLWESSYYQPMDGIYQLILDRCVSKKCFNAWQAYVDAASAFYETIAEINNALWDVQDYADQRQIGDALTRANRESARLPALNQTLLSRIMTFATECGSR